MSDEPGGTAGADRGPFYILLPGPVRSAHDGKLHYIGALALAELYGVPLARCVVWLKDPHTSALDGMVVLRPRADGIYRLPICREAPPDDGASS